MLFITTLKAAQLKKFPWLVLFLALPLVFVGGVMCSDGLRAFGRMFFDDNHPTCIDGSVCVGAEAPKILGSLDGDKHGLTNLFCDGPAHSASNISFLDGVVRGERCPGNNYTVELRGPAVRTLLRVEKGRLVGITEGALHTIDM